MSALSAAAGPFHKAVLLRTFTVDPVLAVMKSEKIFIPVYAAGNPVISVSFS